MDTVDKHLYEYNKKDSFVILTSFLSAVICVFWAVSGLFGLGITLTYCFYIITCAIYLFDRNRKPDSFSVICGILSVLLSCIFFITSNFTVRFFSFPLMIVMGIIFLSSFSDKIYTDPDYGVIKTIFGNTAGAFSGLSTCFKSIASGNDIKKKKMVKALIGLLCSVPVLCVIIPLLINSDAAFEGLVGSMFENAAELIIKCVLVMIIAPFLISFVITLSKGEAKKENKPAVHSVDRILVTSFLSVICVIYVVYLFSQLAYFTSSFSGILPEGYTFTYAEYARRGFFELCAISAINLAVILLSVILSEKKDNKLYAPVKIFGTFIGIFTVFLTCTVIAKMYMYIKRFAMTELRICTTAFMVFISVTFIALIVRLYCKKIPVFKISLVTASVILLILGGANINRFIAEYNYNAYASGKLNQIDTSYYSTLGDEGIPYLEKLLEEDKYRKDAENAICSYIDSKYDITVDYENNKITNSGKCFNHFWDMNLHRKKAYSITDKLLENNQVSLERYYFMTE